MGSYLNPGSKGFQESLNSEIYMDKTGLIEKTNAVLNTRQKFLCVSRPRRFGKSMAADMLAAYYDRGEDSSSLFASLKISGAASYHVHLNQYDVIKVNIQEFLSMTHDMDDMLAMLQNQKVKFRNFFRTVSFFPYVASLVAVAAVWNMIFSPSMGPVNQILATLGVENLPKWAAGKDTAMLTVILFSVWKNMGYYMVIYLAGLQGTNPELEEAAELDGASKWQIFWNVTLPQLKPTTFFVIIMLTIASFKVYDQMYMITQGGPGNATMTLVYYIYNVAFVNTPKYGYASAVSMVLFVLVLFVTIIQFKGSSSND